MISATFFQNWHAPILFKCIRCPYLNYILTHVEIVMVINLVMVFFLLIEIVTVNIEFSVVDVLFLLCFIISPMITSFILRSITIVIVGWCP